MPKKTKKTAIICILISAVVLFFDQLTKYIVRHNLELGEKIHIIGDFANITYVRNYGVAFSMFSGNKLVTVFLTSILIIICLVFLIFELLDQKEGIPIFLSCIVCGGIGNMIDKIYLGYVTDMISCGSFAVFNVADIAITCGAFCCLFYIIFFETEVFKKRI